MIFITKVINHEVYNPTYKWGRHIVKTKNWTKNGFMGLSWDFTIKKWLIPHFR
jgi:hypothetical protein